MLGGEVLGELLQRREFGQGVQQRVQVPDDGPLPPFLLLLLFDLALLDGINLCVTMKNQMSVISSRFESNRDMLLLHVYKY